MMIYNLHCHICLFSLCLRSDVLGQLFPAFGRDWSHEGVASLFSKCVRNNYKIVYLTARAIGQADTTRDYLFGLRQGQAAQLPGLSSYHGF